MKLRTKSSITCFNFVGNGEGIAHGQGGTGEDEGSARVTWSAFGAFARSYVPNRAFHGRSAR
jgi:hypothetical protein